MTLPRQPVIMLVLAFTIPSQRLVAQQLPKVHFTAAINIGSTNLESQSNPKKAIGELLIGVRPIASRHVGLTASAFGGRTVHSPIPPGDVRVCPIDPAGGCKAGVPDFLYGGVQVGGEARFGMLTMSVASGPAAFRFKPYTKIGGFDSTIGNYARARVPASTLLSIHTRAEAALNLGSHFAFVVSSTWRHLPHYRGQPFDVNGFGGGIRIQ